MRYKDISKQTKNGINARMNATVKKYGLDETITVVNKFINAKLNKLKLERQIANAKKELSDLEKQAKK